MKFAKLFRAMMPVACLGSTILTSPGAGTIFLSDIGDSDFGGYGVNGGARIGQPFRTGTSPGGYTLGSIDLQMIYWIPGVSDFRVTLYSNVQSKPAAALEVLSGDNNPFLNGVYQYASSGLTLSPATFYWIVVSASNTSSNTPFSGYVWGETQDTTYAATDGWQIPFGNTHGIYNVTTGQWTTYASSTYGTMKFAVEATPVPEPDPSLFLALGAGCLAWQRVIRFKTGGPKR